MIEAQRQANRIDQTTPFGSAQYTRGPDGRDQFSTTLSPEMQGIFDRARTVASRDLQRYEPPQGFGQFVDLMMSRALAPQGRQFAQRSQK